MTKTDLPNSVSTPPNVDSAQHREIPQLKDLTELQEVFSVGYPSEDFYIRRLKSLQGVIAQRLEEVFQMTDFGDDGHEYERQMTDQEKQSELFRVGYLEDGPLYSFPNIHNDDVMKATLTEGDELGNGEMMFISGIPVLLLGNPVYLKPEYRHGSAFQVNDESGTPVGIIVVKDPDFSEDQITTNLQHELVHFVNELLVDRFELQEQDPEKARLLWKLIDETLAYGTNGMFIEHYGFDMSDVVRNIFYTQSSGGEFGESAWNWTRILNAAFQDTSSRTYNRLKIYMLGQAKSYNDIDVSKYDTLKRVCDFIGVKINELPEVEFELT